MKRFTLSKLLSVLLISTSLTYADSLQDAVNSTIKNNPQIMSIIENDKAYRTYVDEAQRGFYPRIDIEAYGETKHGKIKNTGSVSQDGYNAKIQLEQLLYDGGLTPAKLEEAKYLNLVNQYNNKETVENVLLSTTESYLDLVRYNRRLKLSEDNIKIHEGYLSTAKANEEVSGNALDTYEVTSKLHLAKKNFFEEKDNIQISKNSFKRLTGSDVEGTVCMPKIDRTTLPMDIESLVNKAIQQNNNVLAQIAKISEQRAIINQEKAKSLPVIYAQLSAMRDYDLLVADTKRDIYSARLVLEYNIYNGGKDEISKKREEIFLRESQKILDSKTDLIIDEITSAYNSYINTKDKINELKGYVSSNEDILRIYKDQFEGGTRTFVDVLDIETDLYNARVQLIDEEINLATKYFTMVSLNSELKDTILNQPAQICSDTKVVDKPIMSENDNLSDLQAVLGDKQKSLIASTLIEDIKKEFTEELNGGILEFDTSDISLRFTKAYAAMPIGNDGMLVMTDEYKNQLNDFVPRLIKTIEPYKDSISNVALNGYASSPYLVAKNKSDVYALNLDISEKRAKKVLDYIKGIDDTTVNNNQDIMKLLKAYGKSHDNVILKADGSEDMLLSKRVEFVIIEK